MVLFYTKLMIIIIVIPGKTFYILQSIFHPVRISDGRFLFRQFLIGYFSMITQAIKFLIT